MSENAQAMEVSVGFTNLSVTGKDGMSYNFPIIQPIMIPEKAFLQKKGISRKIILPNGKVIVIDIGVEDDTIQTLTNNRKNLAGETITIIQQISGRQGLVSLSGEKFQVEVDIQ